MNDAGENSSPAINLAGGSANGESLIITHEQGKTFGFKGFYVDNGGFPETWTVIGKKNGVTVNTQAVSTPSPNGNIGLSPALDDVDTVIIQAPGAGFNGANLDSFAFTVPIGGSASTDASLARPNLSADAAEASLKPKLT